MSTNSTPKTMSAEQVGEYIKNGDAYLGIISRAPDGKDYLIIMDNKNHVVEAGIYDSKLEKVEDRFSRIPVAIINDANASFICPYVDTSSKPPVQYPGYIIEGDQQEIFKKNGFGNDGDYTLSQHDRAIAFREMLEIMDQSTLKDNQMLTNCMDKALETMYKRHTGSSKSSEEIVSATGPNSFRYEMKQYVIKQYLERATTNLANERIVAASGFSNEMEKAIARNNIDMIESATRYYETSQAVMSSNKFAAQLERDNLTGLIGGKDQVSYDAIHHAMKNNQVLLESMVYSGAPAKEIEIQREYTSQLTNLYLQHPQQIWVVTNDVMKNTYMHMPPDQTIYPSAAEHLGARTIDRAELFRDAAITYGGRSLPESIQYFQDKSTIVKWIYTSQEHQRAMEKAYNNQELHNPSDRIEAVRQLVMKECGIQPGSAVQDFLRSDDFTKIVENPNYLSTPVAGHEVGDSLKSIRPSESIDMSKFDLHSYQDCVKLQREIQVAIEKEQKISDGKISADLIVLKQTIDDYVTYNKAAVMAEYRHVHLEGLDMPDGKYSAATSAILNAPDGKMRGFVSDLQRYNPDIDFKNNLSMHQMYENYVGMSNITAISQTAVVESSYNQLLSHPKIQAIEGKDMPSPSQFLSAIRNIDSAGTDKERALAVLEAFNLEPKGLIFDERTIRVINSTVTDRVIDDFKEQGTIKRNSAFRELTASLGVDLREQDVSVLRGCDNYHYRIPAGAFAAVGEHQQGLTPQDMKVAQMLDFATAMTETDKKGNLISHPTQAAALEVVQNHKLRNLIIDTVDGQLQNEEQRMAMFNRIMSKENISTIMDPRNTEERANIMAEVLGLTGENGAVRATYGRVVDPNDNKAVEREEAKIAELESKVIDMLRGSEFEREFRRMAENISEREAVKITLLEERVSAMLADDPQLTIGFKAIVDEKHKAMDENQPMSLSEFELRVANMLKNSQFESQFQIVAQDVKYSSEDVSKTDYVMKVERSDAADTYSRLLRHANEFDFKLDWSRVGDRGYLEYLSSTLGPDQAKLKEDITAIMDSSSSAVVQTTIRNLEVAVHQSNVSEADIEHMREEALAIAHREAMKYDPATASRRLDLYTSQIYDAISGETMSVYASAQLESTISKVDRTVASLADSMSTADVVRQPQNPVQSSIYVSKDGRESIPLNYDNLSRLSKAITSPGELDRLIQERSELIRNSEHYADYKKINDFSGKKQELHDIEVEIEKLKRLIQTTQALADEYTEKSSNKLKNALYNYGGSAAVFTERVEQYQTQLRELESQRAKKENDLQETTGEVDKKVKKSLESYQDSRVNIELTEREKLDRSEQFLTDVLKVYGGAKYKSQELEDGKHLSILREKLEKLDALDVPLSIRGDVYQARVDLIGQSRELAANEVKSICDRSLDDLKSRFDPNMSTSTFNADVIQEAMRKIEAERDLAIKEGNRTDIDACNARLAQHQQILEAYNAITSIQSGTTSENAKARASELATILNQHMLVDGAKESTTLMSDIARIEVLERTATKDLSGWNEWVANKTAYEQLIHLQSDLEQMSQPQRVAIAEALNERYNFQQLTSQCLIDALAENSGKNIQVENQALISNFQLAFQELHARANLINEYISQVNSGKNPQSDNAIIALATIENFDYCLGKLPEEAKLQLAEMALQHAGQSNPTKDAIQAYERVFLTSPMDHIERVDSLGRDMMSAITSDRSVRCESSHIYERFANGELDSVRITIPTNQDGSEVSVYSPRQLLNNEVQQLLEYKTFDGKKTSDIFDAEHLANQEVINGFANPNLVAIHLVENLENIAEGNKADEHSFGTAGVALHQENTVIDGKRFNKVFDSLIAQCDMTVEVDGKKQPSETALAIQERLDRFQADGLISQEIVDHMKEKVEEATKEKENDADTSIENEA